jgi:cell division transport system permease protein
MGFLNLFAEKKLGVSDGKRRYDLPLHQDAGTGFLLLLVGLMTFLMALVLTFSFGVNHMMEGWSAGLENKVTLEIPAELNDGEKLRSSDEIKAIQKEVFNALNEAPYVSELEVTSESELKALIQPWLGSSSILNELPMPGLVSVHLNADIPDALEALRKDVKAISPDILLDTHEKWLADLFRLTRSLQFIVLCFVIVIGFTTVSAVVGGVKSQIEIHRPDVELLHLMGAFDSYISRQFVRHSSMIVLLGSFAGVIAALIILSVLGLFLSARDYNLLPALELSFSHAFWLLVLPLFICIVSAVSTRMAVMRVLARMP